MDMVGFSEDVLKLLIVDVEESPTHENLDRKSTRLNSSHDQISYAVFCLKKKNIQLIVGEPVKARVAQGVLGTRRGTASVEGHIDAKFGLEDAPMIPHTMTLPDMNTLYA